MIDTLLPEIQKLVSEKKIVAFKNNGTKTVATGLYNALPVYVRLIVKEKAFVDFCVLHQENIFGKATPIKKPIKTIVAKKVSVKKTAKKLPAKKTK